MATVGERRRNMAKDAKKTDERRLLVSFTHQKTGNSQSKRGKTTMNEKIQMKHGKRQPMKAKDGKHLCSMTSKTKCLHNTQDYKKHFVILQYH